MPYNVFTDFHHASLLNSLILLFEKRLGGKVFRPIGMEWATNGFWKVYDHPETQAQYLGVGANTPDGTPKLNEVVASTATKINEKLQTYIYQCQDIEGEKYKANKAITYEGFMSMPFDIVIASLPQHIEPFRLLCAMHPSKPKLIYQIGNQWDIVGESGIRNVMASALIPSPPEDINFISYHQEFDTNTFRSDIYIGDKERYPENNIYSFVNVFQNFQQDYQLFEEIEKQMPEWSFKAFGGQCRDGSMNGSQELANKMREARFIWHTKAGGDGYGHVIHNSAAVGRPMIVKKDYYRGKLGEKLMIDEVTCLAIDNLSVSEIVNKITHYSDPERYSQLCTNVTRNFKREVDFDKEAEEIKLFLSRLL